MAMSRITDIGKSLVSPDRAISVGETVQEDNVLPKARRSTYASLKKLMGKLGTQKPAGDGEEKRKPEDDIIRW